MCTQYGLFLYICKKIKIMVFVSSREFRADQRKYLEMAQTNVVVISSRKYGNYKLVPLTDDDTIISVEDLDAKIKRGIAEYENGKAIAMQEGESSEAYLERMLSL